MIFDSVESSWNFIFPVSIINSSSDLIKFEENIRNFPISLWIRPLFIIIPLNSRYFHQIGKFGLCFDSRPCVIDDLVVLFRQGARTSLKEFQERQIKVRRVGGWNVEAVNSHRPEFPWACMAGRAAGGHRPMDAGGRPSRARKSIVADRPRVVMGFRRGGQQEETDVRCVPVVLRTRSRGRADKGRQRHLHISRGLDIRREGNSDSDNVVSWEIPQSELFPSWFSLLLPNSRKDSWRAFDPLDMTRRWSQVKSLY